LAKDSSSKVSENKFYLYQLEAWLKYPPELRKLYESHFFTEMADIFVTKELCHELLNNKTVIADIDRNVDTSFW
jgi:hypothetical protein